MRPVLTLEVCLVNRRDVDMTTFLFRDSVNSRVSILSWRVGAWFELDKYVVPNLAQFISLRIRNFQKPHAFSDGAAETLKIFEFFLHF